ncbi:response regulator transcription factor [Piscicoccus intestinalis]|uniref:response regulator transcription factor n=1 Tax=Piscicoccus intestinalis TaxID=746033 RepID=UPI000838D584|nr:response regulator transcription factor [Piscicoccus intestinalis]
MGNDRAGDEGDPNGPLVLLVEDDETLQVTTRLVLQRHGFRVATADDGIDGLEKLATVDPDVLLVDVVMPRMDGITFVRRARERLDVPAVVLTARDLPHDQLAGFEAGADDYVVKPFDGDVLAARLRAVLRRGGAPRSQEVRLGALRIDRPGMVVHRDEERITLSSTEFRLLEAFLDHTGRVLSRPQLLDLVWGDASWGDPHVVEVTVQRLRAKIGAEHIVTVRGAGYKLVGA